MKIIRSLLIMWTDESLLTHYQAQYRQKHKNTREAQIESIKSSIKELTAKLYELEKSEEVKESVKVDDFVDRVSIEDQVVLLKEMVDHGVLSPQDRDVVNPQRIGGLWGHPDNVRYLYARALKQTLIPKWYTEKYCNELVKI